MNKAKRVGFLIITLLAGLSAPALAGSLPKAEEGFSYYCTGARPTKLNGQPNAFLLFKLKKSEVRTEERAMVLCSTDAADERFVLKRFLEPGDKLIEGAVNFTVPFRVDGGVYNLEINTGDDSFYDAEEEEDSFDRHKRKCGVEDTQDNFGLTRLKRKGPLFCRMTSYNAYSFVDGSRPPIKVRCWSDGECIVIFYHHDWEFYVRPIPEKLVASWREIHSQAVKAINDRWVFYVAPNHCFGPLHCSDVANILKIPQKKKL